MNVKGFGEVAMGEIATFEMVGGATAFPSQIGDIIVKRVDAAPDCFLEEAVCRYAAYWRNKQLRIYGQGATPRAAYDDTVSQFKDYLLTEYLSGIRYPRGDWWTEVDWELELIEPSHPVG
jgi:hypothetical protein